MTESFTEKTYDSCGLKPAILRAVSDMGFKNLTPVQAEAIPFMLEGRDVIAQAQTGTGKTAAFGLPILEKCDPDCRDVQALILCPTRELAVQVAGEIRSYAAYLQGIKTLPVYGGQDINRQITALKGTQIVVGTPGRIMDHMRRHTLKLEHVNTVVLDEADEMLDMGFREDMETILGAITQTHQTSMFSATMPQAILELTNRFLTDPVTVQITKEELTIPNIDQYYYSVKREFKVQALLRLIAYYGYKKCMIFCNMKSTVDTLVSELQKQGCMAEALHGDLSQFLRDAAMKRFRENDSCVLVATDIAARGIDVGDVEAVFNYDIPQEAEYYVHRIGRTGRAGKTGVSHTLVGSREFQKIRFIESICHAEMTERTVPNAAQIREARLLQALDQAMSVIASGKNADLLLSVHEYCNTHHIVPEELAAAFLQLKAGDEVEELNIDLPGRKKANPGFAPFMEKKHKKQEPDWTAEKKEQRRFLKKQKEEHFRWGTWDAVEEDYHAEHRQEQKKAGRSRIKRDAEASVPRDKSYPQKSDRKENKSRSEHILAKAVKDVNARGWAAPAKKKKSSGKRT